MQHHKHKLQQTYPSSLSQLLQTLKSNHLYLYSYDKTKSENDISSFFKFIHFVYLVIYHLI